MEPENFVDPIEFIRRLNRAGLRYLLVGRQAVVQYGAPVQSFDFDFFLCPEKESLRKLVELADELNLEHEDVDFSNPPGSLRLFADNIAFDFFRAKYYRNREGEELVFEEMWNRRITKGDSSFSVHVPCLEDLIATKKMRDPGTTEGVKDLEDIKYLDAIRDRFEK